MAKADWLYGIHTVAAVLQRHPERVLELRVQEGRDDARLAPVLATARTLGIACQTLPRKAMDQQFPDANHQGLAARCRLAAAPHMGRHTALASPPPCAPLPNPAPRPPAPVQKEGAMPAAVCFPLPPCYS